MVLVVPPGPGRLRHAGSVTLSIGGAESNVAIGLSRLGVPASWVSALGQDELGELVLHRVRAEGVDTSAVRRVADRPTGLYLREEVAGALRVGRPDVDDDALRRTAAAPDREQHWLDRLTAVGSRA